MRQCRRKLTSSIATKPPTYLIAVFLSLNAHRHADGPSFPRVERLDARINREAVIGFLNEGWTGAGSALVTLIKVGIAGELLKGNEIRLN